MSFFLTVPWKYLQVSSHHRHQVVHSSPSIPIPNVYVYVLLLGSVVFAFFFKEQDDSAPIATPRVPKPLLRLLPLGMGMNFANPPESSTGYLKKNASYVYHPVYAVGDRGVGGGDCTNAQGISDAQHSTADHEDVEEKGASKKGRSPSPAEMLKQLKRFGISGVLSYGLLNTAYYLTTFLFVWFYFAPAPGRMGILAAVERFVKIMAMVWAGSQVTKLARAGGALALAPFVDQGLSWFTVRFKFESRAKAFLAIVGCCVGIAILLFLMVTLHSA
ncbi:hypothetical protein Dimus_021869 [Dionaea muscipula]